MDSFLCKTRIVSGPGALWELSQLGIRRLLVVADPYFRETDVPDKLQQASKAAVTEFFYDVAPDPTVELAAKGTAVVQKFQPDTVVALGGGSAMDCAKAMVYFSGCRCRLVAIPTTSGSGSEVTDFSVLTHGSTKHPLIDSSLLPEIAILDGNLLTALPAKLVADAGYDVVAHGVESYVATGAGAISRALAKDAVDRCFRLLPDSFAGNTRVRQDIHTAATMAGMAFSQSGLGLCHAMAHALGGRFHVAHGRLNAILLPAVVEANAKANAHYAALARGLGLEGTAETVAVRNLKNALLRLRKELKLPGTLAQVGIAPKDVRQENVIRAILADPCCATNPVAPDGAMVGHILQQVSGLG